MFCDAGNEQVKEAIKKNILERLWLMAMSMRDKKSPSQCGTILNKSATGAEYKWGLRFYVLLMECLRQWAAFTADEEIFNKYNDLKDKVPIMEDDVYYFESLEMKPLDHRKVDELVSDYDNRPTSPLQSNQLASIRGISSLGSATEPTEFVELRKYKTNFLNSVFNKTPDVNAISEEHFMFQSLYDSLRYKLNAGKPTATQKADIGFAESISRMQFDTDIQTPKGLATYRGKIGEAIQNAYGEIPREYEAMLGGGKKGNVSVQNSAQPDNVFGSRGNEIVIRERYAGADLDLPAAESLKPRPVDSVGGSNIQNQNQPAIPQANPVFNSGNSDQFSSQADKKGPPALPKNGDITAPKTDPVAQPPAKKLTLGGRGINEPTNANDMYQAGRADFSKKDANPSQDAEKNREANRRLREKKQALMQEVERLKNQERKMRESVSQRSTLSILQKIEHTPEVLIEEIERKNQAYENLQNKYLALLGQMNSKVHSNLEKSYVSGSGSMSRSDPEMSYLGRSLVGQSLYNSRLYMPNERGYGGSSRYLN